MGAWGTGIFSDDDALDIKDGYNNLLRLYVDDNKIKKEMLRRNTELLKSDESVFWYSLAYSMWNAGRLDEDTKNKALYFIDNPEIDGNLELWKEAGEQEYKQRKKVLQNLKQKLLSPQKKRKEYRIPKSLPARFEIGDIVGYKLTLVEYKKFLKARTLHDILYRQKAFEEIKSVFEDKYVYMIKIFDFKYSYDSGISIEEAEKNDLVGHYEFFAVYDLISDHSCNVDEIQKNDLLQTGEIRKNNPLKPFLFELFEYYYAEKYPWDDSKFIDLKKFFVIKNDMSIVQEIYKKYNITKKVCSELLEFHNEFHYGAGCIRPLIKKRMSLD